MQNLTKVCIVASGSKGNSIFISDGITSLLIDAGLSCREIERRLSIRDIYAKDIDALIISHEHSDHIKGAGVFARRFNVPLYINKKTENAANGRLGKINHIENFECGTSFKINTLFIHPFSISHDAADPSGFTINANGSKIGIATDLGIASNVVKEHLKNCSFLMLEANHDTEMLKNGHYPWHLKQRILGRNGHLSNIDAKILLSEINQEKLSYLVLGHLSEHNNTHEKALCIVKEAVTNSETKIFSAFQDESSIVFSV
jgi:phosphoribosyl 1,2-cyclic phosphodiesterase